MAIYHSCVKLPECTMASGTLPQRVSSRVHEIGLKVASGQCGGHVGRSAGFTRNYWCILDLTIILLYYYGNGWYIVDLSLVYYWYVVGIVLVYHWYLAWTQCNLMDMCRIINDNWCWMV